jgi:hypothetical protein
MSRLQPSININPSWATNNLDNGAAGWYQITPTTSNLALRVSSSNIGLTGEIQFTSNNGSLVFQGYNGNNWVDFNSTVGPQGTPGLDFTNAVNFNNLTANATPGLVVSLGQVFATTQVNVAASLSNVNIRAIAGGINQINSNLAVQSLVVSQNSNVITLTSQSIPYSWHMEGSNASVNYLKNDSSDTTYYGWGDTSTMTVKPGYSVVKGQAVRLDSYNAGGSSSNVVITPMGYTTLAGATPYNTPMNMFGVAMKDASSGQSCQVCTHGITTVLCTSNTTTDFTSTSSVASVGLDGLVGKDGGIFCNTLPPATINYYTRAGYFLEAGATIANNGGYALFYVEPRVENV